MPKKLTQYLYEGPLPKVHAGGYAFRAGRPVAIDAASLTSDNKEQLDERGVHAISDKHAAKLSGKTLPESAPSGPAPTPASGPRTGHAPESKAPGGA